MIEGAFAWVGQIAEWVGQFFPRRVILDTTEGAVKYSGFVLPQRWRRYEGEFRVTVHEAGIHWWWPYTSKWIDYPTARQTDRLETQTMETVDGKTFMISGTITYCVVDLMKLLPVVHLATRNTMDLAMAALHDVCCEMTWEELQSEQRRGTLKTKLKNSAAKQLEEYGIKVIKFQLNSVARCRVIKVSQSTSTEEN